MGFFDKFKKNKEDKFDKQIADLQAKNAELTAQKKAEAENGNEESADALKKAADYANIMNAFSAFTEETAGKPLEKDTKLSFKSDGTWSAKKVIKVSAEAEAAYDAAVDADNVCGGIWSDEVLALYQKAADLGSPISCELVGQHYNTNEDHETALYYLKLAIDLGRDVYYSIGSIYDIQYEDYEQADEWYNRGVAETNCKACAGELAEHGVRD